MTPTKIAIIQSEPVFNDLKSSVVKACNLLQEAAKNKAQFVVFGEGWLSGYPAWIDHCIHVGRWDYGPVKEVWAKMYQNSIAVPSQEMQEIQNVAQQHGIYILLGANEIIPKGKGNNTIYNSAFLIDKNGEIKIHHRKLMPTFNERMVHGLGDAHGLVSEDTDIGKIGTLICWEHWMPLSRQALHDEGEDIHVALWPAVKESHLIASRHYAFEGRCFVIATGQILRKSSIPKSLELPKEIMENDSDYILDGGSCIIGPNGEFLLEQQKEIDGIIYFDLPDSKTLIPERMNLAVSGHYQRPDIFEFKIDKRRLT